MVELSQVKIWKFWFLKLTSFAQTWCENVNHVFKKSTSDRKNSNNSVIIQMLHIATLELLPLLRPPSCASCPVAMQCMGQAALVSPQSAI